MTEDYTADPAAGCGLLVFLTAAFLAGVVVGFALARLL